MTQIHEEYSKRELVWIYDFEYTETLDVQFYIECARRFGAPVLELGSGTGRVGIPLATEGFEVWGIEKSPLMIERCKQKMDSSPGAPLLITTINGDMADFKLDRKFRLIIIPVNSFLLLDKNGQIACLECCARHLDRDGALVIDVFHPFGPSRAFDRSNEIEEVEKLVCTRPHPETGRPVKRYISQRRDFYNQFLYVNNVYEVDTAKGTERLSFTEKLRFVYRSEMELMIEKAGMEFFKLFGWYDGREFSALSEVMLFIVRNSVEK